MGGGCLFDFFVFLAKRFYCVFLVCLIFLLIRWMCKVNFAFTHLSDFFVTTMYNWFCINLKWIKCWRSMMISIKMLHDLKKMAFTKKLKNTTLNHFTTTLDTARLRLYELEVISAHMGTSAQYKSTKVR